MYSERALSPKPSAYVFLLVFLTFPDAVVKLFQAKSEQLDALLDHRREMHKVKINQINHDINKIKISTFSIHAT